MSIKDELVHLYKTVYEKKNKEYFDELITNINSIDFKERILQAMRDGYAGFQISNHPRAGTMTSEMKYMIENLLKTKIKEAGLEGLVYIYYQYTNLCLLLRVSALGLNSDGGQLIVHDTGLSPAEKIDQLSITIIEHNRLIKEKIDLLEAEIIYRPGGRGSIMAEKDFIQSVPDLLHLDNSALQKWYIAFCSNTNKESEQYEGL